MTTYFTPTTFETKPPCEGSVLIHRSTGSLRRDHVMGYDQTRQCGNTARTTYFGSYDGRTLHTESLCAFHCRAIEEPIAYPGWIQGAVRLRSPKCRKSGHAFTVKTADGRVFCDECGLPQGSKIEASK